MPSVLQVMLSTMAAGLGVVFNGYILFVFIWNRRIKTANRLLLFHLAFVDILFSFVILIYNTSLGTAISVSFPSISYGFRPRTTFIELAQEDTATSYLCQGNGFLWSALPMVVIWNVCALSCDRYTAINSPLHYSRLVNIKRAAYFLIATWFCGVVLAFLPLLGVCSYTFWDARWACTAKCSSSRTKDIWYAVAQVLVTVMLPVTIIIMCNLHMLIISHYHRNRIVSAIYEMTLKAQASVISQRSPYSSKFNGRIALFTIVQVVGSLAVFTLPYYVVFMWTVVNGQETDAVIVSVTTVLLTCIPSVNAYVYGVKSRMLRSTVKRLLQQHIHKKQTKKDIKKRLSEIFSDTSQRPPPTRRMSAPAECGPVSSIDKVDKQMTKVPESSGTKNSKNPFIRSTSLPESTGTSETRYQRQKVEQNRSEVEILHHPFLERGESAPEDITLCAIPEETSTTERTDSAQNKRAEYERSCSFPLPKDTFRERRVKYYRSKLVRQNNIELISVEEDSADVSENECRSSPTK